ncbi:MAG: phage Gp37/Gp68 family protein [Rhizobiaceae bacterium]|nr:MAG: phage Gp37/Gp68 family protein [Rhizobiaceae bacterium]
MADGSHIEWTEATWNPIAGCSVVSPGCTNCYAMRRVAPRLAANPATPHYAGTVKPSKAGYVWTGKIGIASDEVFTKPLRWKRPRMIFVNSTSDLFHEDIPDDVIDRVFAVMALCPQHTFQVLTKRSKRMREYLTAFDDHGQGKRFAWANAVPLGEWPVSKHHALAFIHRDSTPEHRALYCAPEPAWPLPNVWLGVSAEDQARADERVPDLLATPASIRFVSAEPLLGPIDFETLCTGWEFIDALKGMRYHDAPEPYVGATETCAKLDWIIVGGESGPGARPMRPDWTRSIRDQCAGAGVPFFFKQWGEWLDADQLFDQIERSGSFIARNGERWRQNRPLNFEGAASSAIFSAIPSNTIATARPFIVSASIGPDVCSTALSTTPCRSARCRSDEDADHLATMGFFDRGGRKTL